jgi:hypothetical protein
LRRCSRKWCRIGRPSAGQKPCCRGISEPGSVCRKGRNNSRLLQWTHATNFISQPPSIM